MPRLTYLVIGTSDPVLSARFYRDVLGWTIEERKAGDYRFSDDDAHLIGRLDRTHAAAREAGVLAYFSVASVADAVARTPELGGEVVEAPAQEGDTIQARLRDPAGNLIGIWQFA